MIELTVRLTEEQLTQIAERTAELCPSAHRPLSCGSLC